MFRLALFLALLSAPFSAHCAETRPPVSTIALQLSAERANVGDFTLRDSKGVLFGVGRFLVGFASIYEILVKPDAIATGECEFVYVPVKDGKNGAYATHRMRYWINFGKSTVQLNTDVEGEEITLTFDFDPTKDFADGEIRKGIGHDGKQVGTCSIRIRDPKD